MKAKTLIGNRVEARCFRRQKRECPLPVTMVMCAEGGTRGGVAVNGSYRQLMAFYYLFFASDGGGLGSL